MMSKFAYQKVADWLLETKLNQGGVLVACMSFEFETLSAYR